MNEIKSLIQNELEWCMTHREDSGKSIDFMNGFQEGLRQALRLIEEHLDN